MECNVIRDLLPLYVDGCCSHESAELVKMHISTCPKCQHFLNQMQTVISGVETVCPPMKHSMVSVWKASLLQSVFLFVSFALLTLGVTMENRIKSGSDNGLWAYFLIVPATAMLLSMTNWYFIRLYKNRKLFVLFSGVLFTLVAAVCYIWAAMHYGTVLFAGFGAAAVCGAVSVWMAHSFAKLAGKE